MTKISFLDDYSEGCHPQILDALGRTNMVQQTAYGLDDYSSQAKALIQEHLGDQQADIYFVAGGTLANILVMASCLRPHEAVISANTGHIAMREAGAIEATGHKIVTVPSLDGKLTPVGVQSALDQNSQAPHMVKPRMVYISNATEVGTFYTKAELVALSAICADKNLLLFMDGARLGAALSADKSDLTLGDVAELTDIFWLGGTKAGALLGEAIVINNPVLKEDFPFHIKQRGAMMAKGRLLGIQFAELFKAGLYFDLAKHANQMAEKLSTAMVIMGCEMAAEIQTNQIFAILPNSVHEELSASFNFIVWGNHGKGHSVIRLVTSWATNDAQVDAFINACQVAMENFKAG